MPRSRRSAPTRKLGTRVYGFAGGAAGVAGGVTGGVAAGTVAAGVPLVTDIGLDPKYQKAAATRTIKTTTTTIPFLSMEVSPFAAQSYALARCKG
jgi:hypothetical protein